MKSAKMSLLGAGFTISTTYPFTEEYIGNHMGKGS